MIRALPFVLVASFVIALASVVVDAQTEPTPAPDTPRVDDGEPQVIHPIDHNRAYRHRRDESLGEHERFNYIDIPPYTSVSDWRREMASTQAYDRGFEDGFEEGWLAAQRKVQQDQFVTLHAAAMARGAEHFTAARYGAAARNFILAARNNQGDPFSRLHAAHALTALGHYEDAYHLVRRALELQPNLYYVAFDAAGHFADQAEFDKHLDRVEADAAKDGGAETWALVAYFRYFSDGQEIAYGALQRAAELAPDDAFIARFKEIARLSVPADRSEDE